MSLFHNNILSGSSGGSDPTYVDDVFSTDLYRGTDADTTITNNIDLSGEGGMVWCKKRTSGGNDQHFLFDTERGVTKYVRTEANAAEGSQANSLKAFNSNGFQVGSVNSQSSSDHCAWTFRKAPGFFDVVTYTGNGSSSRTISHSLGSTPGMIWFKRTDSSGNWIVWHRDMPAESYTQSYLRVNGDFPVTSLGDYGNSLTPTADVLNIPVHSNAGNTADSVNVSGASYVAYVFGHDDQSFGEDSDEAIIKCGVYTGNGSAEGTAINLGFEPQWLIIKRATGGSKDWMMFDMMRGLHSGGSIDKTLEANNTNHEGDFSVSYVAARSNGFQLEVNNSDVNGNNDKYIYMAIRRPHKPPEDSSEVFEIDTRNQHSVGSSPSAISNFVVDMAWQRTINTSNNAKLATRLTGDKFLYFLNVAESSDNGFVWDYMNGWAEDGSANSNIYYWMFRRAPGFFDVVTFTGNGNGNRQISHNLKAVPEMAWLKNRTDNGSSWLVHHPLAGAYSNGMQLNSNNGNTGSGIYSASPTSTTVQLNDVSNTAYGQNLSGKEYVLMLFATLSGISKCGSYSGTGSNVTVDCGFSSGPKFILIKRTDSSGNWMYFDTERGIASGSETGLYINDSGTGDTYDYIDTTSSGFIVNGDGGVHTNESGGTFMFWAIAA